MSSGKLPLALDLHDAGLACGQVHTVEACTAEKLQPSRVVRAHCPINS